MNNKKINLENVGAVTHTHTHGYSFNDMLNNIICGDSYELIKNIPDNSIDLVVIDPPYEFNSGTGAGAFGTKKRNYHKEYIELYQKTGTTKETSRLRISAGKEKSKENIRLLSKGFQIELLDELERVMKKTNIYIWCSKAQVSKILNYYESKNRFIDILTWHKTNPIPTCHGTYLNDTEYCIFARESGVSVYGEVKTKAKYYISSANVKDKEKYKHPTIKPINIIKNLIINSSKENDIVLDCFSGSGTTCVASKELKRRFIGIEINPEYHRISIDRLNGVTADGQISFDTDITKL